MENNEFFDRKYMIFNISELNTINFDEIMETSINTVRKNIDNTKTFVKWDTEEIPLSVQSLKTKEGPYTYDEILQIMSTPEWSGQIIPNN